jgi:hypothetical protein
MTSGSTFRGPPARGARARKRSRLPQEAWWQQQLQKGCAILLAARSARPALSLEHEVRSRARTSTRALSAGMQGLQYGEEIPDAGGSVPACWSR